MNQKRPGFKVSLGEATKGVRISGVERYSNCHVSHVAYSAITALSYFV
jgi:hypothetical protein